MTPLYVATTTVRGGGNNTKKKKDKRSSTNKSSSSSIRSSAKSSTYRAFLEVLLLIAESEELKDTQLRLLPFRFIEDVFAQSSVEDCSDIVSKYLFSENFIPKGIKDTKMGITIRMI